MKKVVEFTDKNRILEQAASWILKLESGDGLSYQDKTELREWLDQSPAHREHFERLARTWGGANILTELAVPLHHAQHQSPLQLGLKSMAVAASLLLAVGFLGFFTIDRSPPAQQNGVIATEVGNQKTINLKDGSILKLNTNSKVRIDYSDMYRDIYLISGEAYFDVVTDTDRAFRVYAGGGRIRAIGTAFGVYLKDKIVDVTVSEGRVGVASVLSSLDYKDQQALPDKKNSVTSLGMLRAGEVGSIVSQVDASSQPIKTLQKLKQVTNNDVAKRVSWTEGVLIFAGESLEDVVTEISRYTNVSIEFATPEIKDIRIGGNFPVGETDTMFSSLETNFGLHVTRLDRDRVVISGGKNFH